MKNLLKLSLVCVVILMAAAGLPPAAAQESTAAKDSSAVELFAPASCPQTSGVLSLAGPADGCCERHASICEGICSCGIELFMCGGNSTGGCTSSCKCSKCI